jgi:hypothetical protein
VGSGQYMSHGNVTTVIRQMFGNCIPNMNICQINQLWTQYDTFSLGCLYDAQLLVELSNMPITGTWLNVVQSHIMLCHKQAVLYSITLCHVIGM